MTNVDFDLMSAIEELRLAIANVAKLSGSDRAGLIKAERDVCVKSRALYARYVDIAAWSGVNETERSEVGKALQDAVNALQLDDRCIKSVKRRAIAFSRFRPAATRIPGILFSQPA